MSPFENRARHRRIGQVHQKRANSHWQRKSLDRRPDVIFIVDLKKEKTALNEALLCKTKIVALCDTNVNPDKIDYPIPSNDDAIKTIELITGLAAEAVKEGKSQAASVAAAPAVSVPV
ncbi:MAG: 30S ribosomal protein S2 [Candidatus Magasanikbacteria bacterium]|nr:30S ribosomal protein S2 [Candidatus Magasanikbacteria bacterium]